MMSCTLSQHLFLYFLLTSEYVRYMAYLMVSIFLNEHEGGCQCQEDRTAAYIHMYISTSWTTPRLNAYNSSTCYPYGIPGIYVLYMHNSLSIVNTWYWCANIWRSRNKRTVYYVDYTTTVSYRYALRLYYYTWCRLLCSSLKSDVTSCNAHTTKTSTAYYYYYYLLYCRRAFAFRIRIVKPQDS